MLSLPNGPRSESIGLNQAPYRILLLVGLGTCLGCKTFAFDFMGSNNRGSNEITTVSSRASEDYLRSRRPDGSFDIETYAFGRGGNFGGPDRDPTLEGQSFEDVARAISIPLESQNYLPSKDPSRTKFLVMVYWGTSTGPSSNPGLFRSKTLIDMQLTRNAMLLGYAEDLRATIGLDRTPLGWRRKDLFGDLRANRYFVVLMAYDFQLMWKEKRHRLIWETRFSLPETGHEFGKELPMMAKYASRYFGRDSHGLIRDLVPEGRVEIGAVKSLGSVPEK
jgi:hypothetical protein